MWLLQKVGTRHDNGRVTNRPSPIIQFFPFSDILGLTPPRRKSDWTDNVQSQRQPNPLTAIILFIKGLGPTWFDSNPSWFQRTFRPHWNLQNKPAIVGTGKTSTTMPRRCTNGSVWSHWTRLEFARTIILTPVSPVIRSLTPARPRLAPSSRSDGMGSYQRVGFQTSGVKLCRLTGSLKISNPCRLTVSSLRFAFRASASTQWFAMSAQAFRLRQSGAGQTYTILRQAPFSGPDESDKPSSSSTPTTSTGPAAPVETSPSTHDAFCCWEFHGT